VNNGSVKEILNLSSKDSKETGLKPLKKKTTRMRIQEYLFLFYLAKE
jgi:hypothetical protein